MQEALIQYIWEFQFFDHSSLATTSGDALTIRHPGIRNTHAGPDFSNGRVRIGELEWIGHVEIHFQSSEWYQHHHQHDQAYDNVILHVVWKDDKEVLRKDGTRIPTLELKDRVNDLLLIKYKQLVHNPQPIPCAAHLSQVRALTVRTMVERATVSRLERKAELFHELLRINDYDREETAYQILARNYGFKVNAEAFLFLAKALPLKFILRHAAQLMHVEALLFGQAGFLESDPSDDYTRVLQREYRLLSKKFGLQPRQLHQSQWKFLRLRPANFPTLRIAQFAALLFERRNLFSGMLTIQSHDDALQFFSVQPSLYWQNHYDFGKPAPDIKGTPGKDSIDNLVINSVVAVRVAVSKLSDDPEHIERALDLLQQMKSENNTILRQWGALGVKSETAFDGQGLLELYQYYCQKRRCLDCSIGSSLVR